MDEQAVFAEAESECLKECFRELHLDLSIPTHERLDGDSPETRFRDCCDRCRRARAIADGGAAPA